MKSSSSSKIKTDFAFCLIVSPLFVFCPCIANCQINTEPVPAIAGTGQFASALSPGIPDEDLSEDITSPQEAGKHIPNTGVQRTLLPEKDVFGSEIGALQTEPKTQSTFFEQFIQDKLLFGTRITQRILTDSDSGHKGGTYGTGTYLGTIYALDEQQNYTPNKFFLTYYFTKYFGFELAYDSIGAQTIAIDSDTQAVKTDGNVFLSGPTVTLLAKYPNSTAFSPYFGIGLGFFKGDFDETADWAYSDWGWAERKRVMVVDNTTAVLLTTGLTWSFHSHWLLDCSFQYVHADADAVFYGFTNGIVDTEQAGHFPLDNITFRLGIAYSF